MHGTVGMPSVKVSLADHKLSVMVVKGCCKWPEAPKLSPASFAEFHSPPSIVTAPPVPLVAPILSIAEFWCLSFLCYPFVSLFSFLFFSLLSPFIKS